MSSDDREKGIKRFDGSDEDSGRQLRRWKAWTQAKMATMKDFSPKQAGPWLFTLLDGKALDAVEHLTLEELSQENGAKTVFELLAARFPEKEKHDQMGEALGEVFGLAAKESETVQQWTARVKEVFEKCRRKADVAFPGPAQGWIMLNCAGLTEEQKAIVKAKAQGSLDVEQISASFRSFFPMYKAGGKARRPVSTLVVEPEDQDHEESVGQLDHDFADVEAFLADHNLRDNADDEVLDEDEAAEALAVTWRERRQEISRLQRGRKFADSQGARKSFRVEIEELKRRTRCRKCGKVGHWQKECRSSTNAKGASKGATSSASASADVHFVEHRPDAAHEVSLAQSHPEEGSFNFDVTFVGAAECWAEPPQHPEALAAGLVSSPGFGVIDSGCGRTLIGQRTLEVFQNKLSGYTKQMVEEYETMNMFRYGNGATEVSRKAVRLPVAIGGRCGLIDAAVIEGQAPLLLGRPTLEKLRAQLNFQDKTLSLLNLPNPLPMKTNSAGQLLLDVLDFPPPGAGQRVGYKVSPKGPESSSSSMSGDQRKEARGCLQGLEGAKVDGDKGLSGSFGSNASKGLGLQQPHVKHAVASHNQSQAVWEPIPNSQKHKNPSFSAKHTRCLLAQVKPSSINARAGRQWQSCFHHPVLQLKPDGGATQGCPLTLSRV